MSKLDARPVRLWFAGLALFTGLAGDFWRNLLSWYGFGAIVLLLLAAAIVLLARNRDAVRVGRMPYPLLAFLALATTSIAWSFYPGSTALGIIAQWITTIAALPIALLLTWTELLAVLGRVLRVILALSFLFEFVVAAFIRHPVFPVWVVPDNPGHVSKLLYWSRDLLFSTGKIQGIVGNSSLLAMIALIALIVFAIQLACRSVGLWGWFWVIVALGTIGITRSATIFIAIVAVAILAAAALIVRRAATGRARALSYSAILAVVGLAGALGVVFRSQLLDLLGKSGTLTGRQGIWDAVIALAQQRPAFGWGWVSYWTPWVEPFKHLIVRGGVQVMHAHNAWLDVWLQLGILGLVVFGLLVVSTLVRSWTMATTLPFPEPSFPELVEGRALEPQRPSPSAALARAAWVAMLPLLVLAALLVQSLAESRILVEGGWVLLVVLAVKTKLRPLAIELEAATESAAERSR
ncbi:O-antigen ligase family protein [Parafrigoribacterium soli]|uniref:O-antigen ligase family protein n=1 Tax=Parafrigoribacterium soli TaxID=3144663 RepID=UPI0032EFB9D3